MNAMENIPEKIDRLYPGMFSQLDIQFADFLCDMSGTRDPEFILSARLVSRFISDGNICLDIPSVSGRNIFDILGKDSDTDEEVFLYNEKGWINRIKKNSCIGRPGDFKPLILDERNRLYLYRYWQYEQKFAENIKKRIKYNFAEDIDIELLKDSLARLFNLEDDNDQRVASAVAVLKKFCVISGGPGTGKTSTVVKILIMLIEQANLRNEHLRIAIAAPTGKAAARIDESIKDAIKSLNCELNIIKDIPLESFTIHRLLRPVPGLPYFYYNQKKPLPYDVVVIDESSMADLALISRLFEAVPPDSRIILLGDKDQLASVEAGAVLGDICGTGDEHKYSMEFRKILNNILGTGAGGVDKKLPDASAIPVLADSIALLNRNYRFKKESGINELCKSIKAGDTNSTLKILKSNKFSDVSITEIYSDGIFSEFSFGSFISKKIISGYNSYLKAGNPHDALREFRNFTILCALRNGPFGVERLNVFAEELLAKKGLISIDNQWYEGRPVMILRNDYNIQLYNGDAGILFKDKNNSKIYFFIKSGENLRKIIPLKLPEHETVYAITVHKSQGSEFNNVLIVLPDMPGPLLTRELLYTAVTRARYGVEILGSESVIRYMIENPTRRISGLKDNLWMQ